MNVLNCCSGEVTADVELVGVKNPHRNLVSDCGLQRGGGKPGWVIPDRRKNTKVFRSASEASLLFREKNGAPEGVWCLCAGF